MSAAEKLKALERGHEPVRILPIARKTNTKLAGFEAWTRAQDVEKVMDALPQIVAVVALTEQNVADYDAAMAKATGTSSSSAAIPWIKTRAALAALDEALT